MGKPFWNETIRHRWFFGYLACTSIAVVWLFRPFLFTLMFAGVAAVVTWPLFEWVLGKVKGRRALGAMLTVVVLLIAVIVPLTVIMAVFFAQAVQVEQATVAWIKSGGIGRFLSQIETEILPPVEEPLKPLLGAEFDLLVVLRAKAQVFVANASNAIGGVLAGALNTTFGLVIFLFSLVSFYMKGPLLVDMFKNLSPMDDHYEDQLLAVFRLFSRNMVIDAVATSFIQGLIATIGYAIVGVPSLIFLGILTGLGAIIPMVGTMLVWLPVVLFVAVTQGTGWALFLAAWNLLFTGSVDNLLKPVFLGGGTDIHPLLIFLGVFGGLTAMGVPGVLVGPVIVALFLTLYHIYVTDFLHKDSGLEVELPDIYEGPPSIPEA